MLQIFFQPGHGAVGLGHDPGRRALIQIEPRRLLESWSRHLLVAINAWEEGVLRPLHADWCGRAFHLGKDVAFTLGGTRYEGQFAGLDEKGGMVLKSAGGSRILPLTLMLEEA